MKVKTANQRIKSLLITVLIILFTKPLPSIGQVTKEQKYIFPAQQWLDNKGKPINAHGSGILFHQGIYYWYGEHQLEGKSEADFADGGIHCYSSTDLINWTDVGVVLSVDYADTTVDLHYGCVLERPKVIYNKKTSKFIAYFKYYPKGSKYEVAYVGVAIADSPAGPFRYSHKFLAANSPKGSGDFSMFMDKNDALYHIAVRKPDKFLVKAKMRDDYLLPESNYEICKGIERHTEAPAIVKIDGIYHLLGSASSGWTANTARYYTSTNIDGPWINQGNPCTGTNTVDNIDSSKTFGSQSCFIFPVNGLKGAYVAMFDIWAPEMPINGRYIWLPLSIKDKKMSINWLDKWNQDVFQNK